jgi:hypothetical protein
MPFNNPSAFPYSNDLQNWQPLPVQTQTQANRTSSVSDNPVARGIALHINLANLHGAPTFTIKIQWVTSNGSVFTMQQTGSINANGDYWFLLHPTASLSGGGWNSVWTAPLPGSFQLLLGYSGTPGTDYADTTVEAQLLL